MVYHNTHPHAIEKIKHIWLVNVKEIILFFIFLQVHHYPKIIKLKKPWKERTFSHWSRVKLWICIQSHTACFCLPGISASNSKPVQESPAWVSDIAQSFCCKGRGALSQCLMPTSEEPSLFTMHRWKIKRRLMQLALVSENSSPQNSLINVLRFRF